MKLVLASASPHRKELVAKLGLKFICVKPSIDEESLKNELQLQNLSPVLVAETLSYEKGYSVYKKQTDSLIISGDQLVCFKNQILGKPQTYENAVRQLELLNNNTHQLITSITVFNAGQVVKYNHFSNLKMKNLNQNEIKNYVHMDNPLDCSGSYKIEQCGITLFESIDCDDFTAIQGIPMLWLSNYLKGAGYEFFKI